MGISITSKNISTDIPASGFMLFRKKVAELTSNEIFEHYKKLIHNSTLFAVKDLEEYNKETKQIAKKYPEYKPVLNFLYTSDIKGKANKRQCKKILAIIENYNDDLMYGYAGWGNDTVKFSDIKEIVRDGAKNRGFKWY